MPPLQKPFLASSSSPPRRRPSDGSWPAPASRPCHHRRRCLACEASSRSGCRHPHEKLASNGPPSGSSSSGGDGRGAPEFSWIAFEHSRAMIHPDIERFAGARGGSRCASDGWPIDRGITKKPFECPVHSPTSTTSTRTTTSTCVVFVPDREIRRFEDPDLRSFAPRRASPPHRRPSTGS